jgi:YVTN family beta-propeller protein
VGPVFLASATVSGTTKVFVAGFKSGTVPVVNASMNPPAVIATIPVGDANSHPVAITSLPDGSKVYVLNRDAGNVKVITTGDNAITGTIEVGGNPVYAVANPKGSAMYVLSAGSSPYVKVISPDSDSVTQTVTLPGAGNPTCLATPMQTPCASMVFEPTLQRLYVANYSANSISIFDASAGTLSQVGSPVAVGAGPTAIAPLADGSRVYVLNRNAAATDGCGASGSAGQFSVISTSNNTVVACVAVAGIPVWIAASGDGTKVLVPHQGGTPGTQVVATATNTVTADLPAPFVAPDTADSTRMLPVFVIAQ